MISCAQANSRIQVTESAHLDPDCVYRAGIDVTASNVVLDCRGATIDPADARSGVGIHVHSDAAHPLENVEVRNCITRGFTNGIRVSRDNFRSLTLGHEYDTPTRDIRLVNNDVSASNGTGVFVNAYVTDVTIDRQRVHGAGGPGIYLEAGSKQTTIHHSSVIGNGYATAEPNMQTRTMGANTFGYYQTGREGIAVDGSRDNVITNNVIGQNAYGGVLLYKNCGEFATEKPSQWWTRPYGATGNTITNNLIIQEDNGVWVGSRMAENTEFFDCSDTPYLTGPLQNITLDDASDNTITNNTFAHVTHAIRIEDDRTTVTGNRFVGSVTDPTFPASEAVLVGTKYRTELLGLPVTGTDVHDNIVELDGISEPYRWIHAPVPGFTAGTQPTIDPFLMVAKIWLITP